MDKAEFQANNKMTEVEVSLRLAFFVISNGLTSEDIEVAIDGAQVKTAEKVHFEIKEFLNSEGWHKANSVGSWQGVYENACFQQRICIHSTPGRGDVVVHLKLEEVMSVRIA